MSRSKLVPRSRTAGQKLIETNGSAGVVDGIRLWDGLECTALNFQLQTTALVEPKAVADGLGDDEAS